MRGRVTDRSSILLLGRNTVIIGAIVITVVSLGIGYFLGYKGGNFGHAEKQDQSSAESKLPLPAEDKRVLETPPGDRPVLPSPSKPPAVQAETDRPKTAEQAPGKQDKEDTKSKKTPEASAQVSTPATTPIDKKDSSGNAPTGKKESAAVRKAEKKASKAQDKTAGQPDAGAAENTVRTKGNKGVSKDTSGKKLYTIQFGAFPSPEGAAQLQQSLKGKGVTAYVVNRTEGDPYCRVRAGSYNNRKEAERTAISLQKRTGLPNFVTIK